MAVTRKLKQPIAADEALRFVRSLASFPLVPVDYALIQRGAALSQRFQISYWDGTIIAAAERLSARVVYSEDMNHGQRYGSVTVLNPFRR